MQKKLIISILSGILLVTLINSCQNESANNETAELSEAHKEGMSLMIQNCYTCHNPKTTEDKRLAPPMIAVKRHYTDETNSKEEFIAAFSAFMNNPTKENSKMPNAIKRFGIMPNLSFPKEKYY